MRIRTLWLRAHLWVGLAIALPLIVVALSGSVLVFEDALDRALNPALSFVTPGNRPMPLDEIVPRVRAAYPDALLSSFSFPEQPDLALQIAASAKAQGPFTIAVDQYTAQVLGTRSAADREAGLARRIHLLHTRLFAGQVGEWIVGLITALTLFMAIAGLVLWWPRKIITVKRSASGRRINFDLHNVFGFYASAVFLFIALTGMMISFEAWTDPLFMRLNETAVLPPARESTAIAGATPIGADALASAAQAALPGAFLKGHWNPQRRQRRDRRVDEVSRGSHARRPQPRGAGSVLGPGADRGQHTHGARRYATDQSEALGTHRRHFRRRDARAVLRHLPDACGAGRHRLFYLVEAARIFCSHGDSSRSCVSSRSGDRTAARVTSRASWRGSSTRRLL